MVDVGNMSSADFITAKDMKVGDRVKVKVTGEGKMQPADENYKAALLLEVEFNGKKTLRLGTRNVQAISAKLGRETKGWIGQTLEFMVYTTNYQNKLGFQYVG